jgi:hypothetical protein
MYSIFVSNTNILSTEKACPKVHLPGRKDSVSVTKEYSIITVLRCLSFVCALIPKIKKYGRNCKDSSGLRSCKIVNLIGNNLKFKLASMKYPIITNEWHIVSFNPTSFALFFIVLQSPPPGQNAPSLASPGVGSRNRGLLQDGDIEGVRQLNVNIPIIQDATEADINAWRNRTIVPKLKRSEAKYVLNI